VRQNARTIRANAKKKVETLTGGNIEQNHRDPRTVFIIALIIVVTVIISWHSLRGANHPRRYRARELHQSLSPQ
jgi:hypothetical protein